MRKREIQILFRLNEEEAKMLNRLVERSGYTREAFLRNMISGYQLCEKPDPEFYKIMQRLSAMGNNLNQIVARANTLGWIDTPALREEAERWHKFQLEIRQAYLLPKRRTL